MSHLRLVPLVAVAVFASRSETSLDSMTRQIRGHPHDDSGHFGDARIRFPPIGRIGWCEKSDMRLLSAGGNPARRRPDLRVAMRRFWTAILIRLALAAGVLAAGFGSPLVGHSHSSVESAHGETAAHDHGDRHHEVEVFDPAEGPALHAGSGFHLHGDWLGIAYTIAAQASEGKPRGYGGTVDLGDSRLVAVGGGASEGLDGRSLCLLSLLPGPGAPPVSLLQVSCLVAPGQAPPRPDDRLARSAVLRC